MPTIAIFFGLTIQMYWRDRPPPHVHALYGGAESLIAIETGEVIGGRLPPAALRLGLGAGQANGAAGELVASFPP